MTRRCPGIIKYPFWRLTAENPAAEYACVNCGEASCPKEIVGRSIVINADIGEVVSALLDGSDDPVKPQHRKHNRQPK